MVPLHVGSVSVECRMAGAPHAVLTMCGVCDTRHIAQNQQGQPKVGQAWEKTGGAADFASRRKKAAQPAGALPAPNSSHCRAGSIPQTFFGNSLDMPRAVLMHIWAQQRRHTAGAARMGLFCWGTVQTMSGACPRADVCPAPRNRTVTRAPQAYFASQGVPVPPLGSRGDGQGGEGPAHRGPSLGTDICAGNQPYPCRRSICSVFLWPFPQTPPVALTRK